MKYIEGFMVSILAIFAPIQASLVALFVLILMDLFTGVWAASKRGEKVTSAGLRRSVSKIVVYEIAVVMGYVAEHYLLTDFLPLAKLIMGTITMVELKSLFENLDVISGQPLLHSLINKIGSKNGME